MKPAKKPHGEIRQSQLITTFGPGSMLDLLRPCCGVGVLVGRWRDYFRTEVIQEACTSAGS